MSDPATRRTAAFQTSLPMRFLRQESWSELLLSSLGDRPDPGIEPTTSSESPVLAAGFFTPELPGKHCTNSVELC